MERPHSADLHEGIFHGYDTNFDEVDGSRVIQLVKERDVPLKYCLSNNSERKSQQILTYKLVHTNWGSHISKVELYGGGLLALVTFGQSQIFTDEHKVKNVADFIKSKVTGHQCESMRYGANHILFHVSDGKCYHDLGEAFMLKQFDTICAGYQVISIEPALLVHLPRCFLEIESQNIEALCHTLTDIVIRLSPNFKFIALRDVGTEKQPDGATSAGTISSYVPCFCITMLFAGASQKNAQAAIQSLSREPWKQLKVPEIVSEVLENNTQFYVNQSTLMPAIAVKTGCSQPGVQITIFVQKPENFSAMEKFYEKVIGKKPYDRNAVASNVHYSIFALSKASELFLAYFPGLAPSRVGSTTLNVQVFNFTSFPGATKVEENQWLVLDPEENKVVFFSVLRK